MVKIDFANDEREIRLNIKAMREAEALTGQPTSEIIRQFHAVSLTMLGVLLYVGMRHEDKALTLKTVERHLDRYADLEGGSLKTLRKAVIQAIDEATWWQQMTAPEPDEEEKDREDGDDDEDDVPSSRPAPAS